MTYQELAVAVPELASGLFDRDARQDDVVALCAPNSIEFVLAWYPASSIGAIVTTLNPASTAAELTHQLRTAGARWLVTTAQLYDEKLRGAADAAGIGESMLIGATGEPRERAIAFDSLHGGGHTDPPPVHVSPATSRFSRSRAAPRGCRRALC